MKRLLLPLILVFLPLFASAANTMALNKNGEMIALLILVNKHEIELAKLALSNAQNPQVKAYADMMIKDHGANLEKTQTLEKTLDIKPVKNDLVLSMEKQGMKETHNLNKLKGNSFDVMYIDAMIKGHQDMLTILNATMDQIDNPVLKEHVTNTKKSVEHHLNAAKEVKTNLNQKKAS